MKAPHFELLKPPGDGSVWAVQTNEGSAACRLWDTRQPQPSAKVSVTSNNFYVSWGPGELGCLPVTCVLH